MINEPKSFTLTFSLPYKRTRIEVDVGCECKIKDWCDRPTNDEELSNCYPCLNEGCEGCIILGEWRIEPLSEEEMKDYDQTVTASPNQS